EQGALAGGGGGRRGLGVGGHGHAAQGKGAGERDGGEGEAKHGVLLRGSGSGSGRSSERAVSLNGVVARGGGACGGPAGYPFAMLHLASKSPRRRELLGRLGLAFGVLDVDVPEQRGPGEAPAEYVRRVAREKAGAGLLRVAAEPGAVVLGADTEVILGDEVFGKPRDAADAVAMLRRLSGRTHEVVSAVSVVSAEREAQAVSVSQVVLGELPGAGQRAA